MIILKILLYILLCVVVLILLVLILPISADVSFIDGILKYKLKFSLIPLADSDGKGILRKKNKNKKSVPEVKESEEIPESFPEDDDISDYEDYENYEYSETEEENYIDIDIPVIEDFEEYEEELTEEKERSEKILKIKEKKSAMKEESPEEEEEEKNSLTDKIEFLINIWDIAGRPLLKIFRGFHIRKVYIDFIVAGEDAFKCAVAYGAVSGTVYNLLAWLSELFTVSYKTVDIRCGFALKKSQWDASCKVNFRLYTLVFSALWFMTVYLFRIYIPKKKAR